MGGSRGYKNIFTAKPARPAPDFYNVKLRELFGSGLTLCTHATPTTTSGPRPSHGRAAGSIHSMNAATPG